MRPLPHVFYGYISLIGVRVMQLRVVWLFVLFFAGSSLTACGGVAGGKHKAQARAVDEYARELNRDVHSAASPLYDLSVYTLEGVDQSLSAYRNKVLLISNIALNCGTTPQLSSLQQLYEQYKDDGLIVMGFPAAEFTENTPQANRETKRFCSSEFGVTFPLFRPISMYGSAKHPLFEFLTSGCPETMSGEIIFNFEKFLIDKQGRVVARYGSFTGAMSTRVRDDIERLLVE